MHSLLLFANTLQAAYDFLQYIHLFRSYPLKLGTSYFWPLN